VAAILWIAGTPAFPQSLQIDASQQFSYAESLFSKQQYPSAVFEYQRFVYFFEKDSRVEKAMFRIGEAHFQDGRTNEAIRAFSDLISRFPNTALAVDAFFEISRCHMQRQDPVSAEAAMHNLISISDDRAVIDRACNRLGWIQIENGQWEKAKSYFDRISPESRALYQTDGLSQELDRANALEMKNPAAAGVFSLIPGGGFLYCERYRDALVAFLLNGALIWAAVESFENEQYALGGAISFVEFGFYAGNIHGGISSAHKYNREKARGFIRELKQNARMQFSAKDNGFELSLRCVF
jgi:tetratricopeptide (TPR) repeat protein